MTALHNTQNRTEIEKSHAMAKKAIWRIQIKMLRAETL
jgi:hypothetical protein